QRVALPPQRSAPLPYTTLFRSGFFRYRLLEDTAKGFQKLTGKPGPKYLQPPGTVPEAYLAPFINWREIATDPDTTLVITEGEKKDRKSTRLNSSHVKTSYAVFC